MPPPKFDITYTELPDGFYTPYQPVPSPSTKPVLLNNDVAEMLDIDTHWLHSEHALKFFSGQAQANTYTPIAMAYSGHQFGGFSPSLGDGRAALIGELLDGNNIRYDVHLKGSGRTPYSRGGDGKATLRAVLKEYIFSESLAGLGIPTTRSLAAIITGETVRRQGGHPGAILVRTAKSHIRVGTFQYARLMQDGTALKALADFTIARLYPKVDTGINTGIDANNPYTRLLSQAIEKQASLVAKWMSFGFIHGVMNTDNMAISGETIDFGPCAFMEVFRADQVFSSTDHHGRYAWNKQSEMAFWNLTRLAESLLPLLHDDQDKAVSIAETELAGFSDIFAKTYNGLMLAKLGLMPDINSATNFITDTLSLLSNAQLDFTLFFWHLTKIAQGGRKQAFTDMFTEPSTAEAWLKSWRENFVANTGTIKVMQNLNPLYIPRFSQLETALAAAEDGDLHLFTKLLTAVSAPFDEKDTYAHLAKPAETHTAPQTFCET